jgi:hypothetical protein
MTQATLLVTVKDGRLFRLTEEKAYRRSDGVIKKTKDTGQFTFEPVVRYHSNWMSADQVPKKPAAKKPAAKKPAAKKPAKKEAALPDDLSELSLKDLRKLAAEVGVEGRSSMDKNQLVKALG